MCVEAENVLILVLNRYRNQVIAKKLSNISKNDEEYLLSLAIPDELCEYNGLVHVIDLAMILEEMLFYFVPNNIPLSFQERGFIIDQFDAWVTLSNIDYNILESLTDFDSIYNMAVTANDSHRSNKLKSNDQEYYIPNGIFKKSSEETRSYNFKSRKTKTRFSTKFSDIRSFLKLETEETKIISNQTISKEIVIISNVGLSYNGFRSWFLSTTESIYRNREKRKVLLKEKLFEEKKKAKKMLRKENKKNKSSLIDNNL